MYRFLLTPRWLAAAALTVVASVVMVMLGNWQLHRYQERTAINDRIDAANTVDAVALTSVLTAPTAAGTPGAAPGKALAWTKVTLSGRYDPANEIQARGRTVGSKVGFEILTPLLLEDGTAVLVDRGWVPAPPGGALAAPEVPPAPTGQVTVVGQIHLSESRPAPVDRRDGRLDTRRISLPRLATELPFPVYGAYVLLTEQTPAADPAFVPIPIPHEDSWQNGGYAVQWWVFAGMVFVLYGWQARREALESASGKPSGARPARKADRSRDRVEAADQRKASRDRVEEADRRAAASRSATVTADRPESD
ncbi:cytochrome oxidase assembly protein ShyY1 [Actinoplanes campanulatus]|uniref:SURF1-like protein n=1 Tax=Actinoplanes campanulatus TaxID=113559 RepID=A0A7W5AS24_9ACTN|nr:SURF1 family protein [Actinoplanes campanulatus]MBB3101338.1 cytochrome oxidase assembly protein ShyY1 [Actinoplanes campanulatus]GGN48430.1 SURF1-like protein [Actinoplanes campanulatus]GID41727.1 SURF1-like protein [Actinoplanes campanulatus]